MDDQQVKEIAKANVHANAERLVQLSHELQADPEVAFEEHRSIQRIADLARTLGSRLEVGYCDLKTAFVCRAGSGTQAVALCAEYDALPGIGHACGHNIIAASSLGAFIALSAVAEHLPFRVLLVGTPGEERIEGAGKVVLLERGGFEGVAAALMVHPAPFDIGRPIMTAAAELEIAYAGRASHAAFYPELGINAADALTVAQVGVGLLRQHIRPADRVHGITLRAGEAPNVVPASAAARYIVRSRTLAELNEFIPRVRACFEAGAIATGASVAIQGGSQPYADMVHDQSLSDAYIANARALGRDIQAESERPTGSTDMGNVSQVIPSIHPFIGIGSWPAVNHQPEFAAATVTAEADRAVIDAATALAWTVIDSMPDYAAHAGG